MLVLTLFRVIEKNFGFINSVSNKSRNIHTPNRKRAILALPVHEVIVQRQQLIQVQIKEQDAQTSKQ